MYVLHCKQKVWPAYGLAHVRAALHAEGMTCIWLRPEILAQNFSLTVTTWRTKFQPNLSKLPKDLENAFWESCWGNPNILFFFLFCCSRLVTKHHAKLQPQSVKNDPAKKNFPPPPSLPPVPIFLTQNHLLHSHSKPWKFGPWVQPGLSYMHIYIYRTLVVVYHYGDMVRILGCVCIRFREYASTDCPRFKMVDKKNSTAHISTKSRIRSFLRSYIIGGFSWY